MIIYHCMYIQKIKYNSINQRSKQFFFSFSYIGTGVRNNLFVYRIKKKKNLFVYFFSPFWESFGDRKILFINH